MSGLGGVLALTSLPQKLLAGALGVALIGVGIHDVVEMLEIRHLQKQTTQLDKRINDPKTGYVVKLSQAETNTQVCSAAIGRQNDAIKAQSTKDAAAVAAVQAHYDTEHAARVKAENSAAAFLAHTPQGATLIDRVSDVDAQILGDIK